MALQTISARMNVAHVSATTHNLQHDTDKIDALFNKNATFSSSFAII